MSKAIEKNALERVRYARHQISEQFGHDPKKLVAHYINLQQNYKDCFLDTGEKQKISSLSDSEIIQK